MKLFVYALLATHLALSVFAENFQIIDSNKEVQSAVRLPEPVVRRDKLPKARAGVLVARYVPQNELPPDVVLGFANITYRIVGVDMTLSNIQSKYDAFRLVFYKLYGGANLHVKAVSVRAAEPGEGTRERPCQGDFDGCCLHKGPIADPATWAAVDVTLEVGCSRESLWPDQGSVDWAHSRMLGTHLHSIGIAGRLDWAQSRMIGTLFAQHGFNEVRCLLQRADVLSEGVHAHKYLPITALYTEETEVQFTGNSLSQWLPVDLATQNLILHSMDLIGLNRIAGCARIRITKVSQRCHWEPGRGQTGVANVTFVTHREYPETTLPMAFAKTFHILLERLNEEGLNLAKIEVVGNRIVKGPEWGNMHDQIEGLLSSNDTVRTYETRVPVEELPNFKRSSSQLPRAPLAVAVAAIAVGAVFWQLKRRTTSQPQAARPSVPSPEAAHRHPPSPRIRTQPLSAIGASLSDELPIPDISAFMRRESAPAAQGMREMWEKSVPSLPHYATTLPSAVSAPQAGYRQQAHFDPHSLPVHQEPTVYRLYNQLRTSRGEDREAREGSMLSSGSAEFTGAEFPSAGSSHPLSPWSASSDSPNPFLQNAALPMPSRDFYPGSGSRPQNFTTVPAAIVINQGSLQDTATEQQREEHFLRSQKMREQGAKIEEQLARLEENLTWMISEGEIEICIKEDKKRWLLGAGSYGKVYRGIRGGVQDVAVKVLHTSDEMQVQQFCKEITMLKTLSFDRNIVQFLGVCLHAGSPMMVLELMEGGDLRQVLSGPDAHNYNWNKLGQHVAIDVIRGLHFLHSKNVVHSDLKSRNVLLGRDGRTAKLSDVGMSRILSGSRSAPVAGDVPGTFPYAAPELLLAQACTVKADIFSLGVLLWEIITKEIPVRGMLRDLEVPDECSEAVNALVKQCMHFDPSQRPTARQVFDKIKEAENSQIASVFSLPANADLPSGLS